MLNVILPFSFLFCPFLMYCYQYSLSLPLSSSLPHKLGYLLPALLHLLLREVQLLFEYLQSLILAL